MFKFIQWLGKMVIGAALVSVVSVYVAWSTVEIYVERLMKEFQLNAFMQKPEFSDLVSKLSKSTNILKTADPSEAGGTVSSRGSNAESIAAGTEPLSGTEGASTTNGQSGESSSGTSPVSPSPNVPRDAIAVMGQASSEAQSQQGGLSSEKRQMVLSAEDFFNKKEKMSGEDKMKVFTILANRVPQKELQQLSAYVENGITEEEMTAVEQIIQKYVKPEEIDQLMAILNKY